MGVLACDVPRLFLNGAYFPAPSPELSLSMKYIRTLDGRTLT